MERYGQDNTYGCMRRILDLEEKMGKYLFIAEKKSLMDDVRKCYEKHKPEVVSKVGQMDFIALSGHVCRNCDPDSYDEWKGASWDAVDYPMIPVKWKTEPIENEYKKKALGEIRDHVDEYDGVVVGTDSDTEGYGIYHKIEEMLGLHDKKALRFIEHSLTDDEILESLLTMTDIHTDPVHIRAINAYIIRSNADWLYGMNITRMVTVRRGELMTIGRVKSPTISLVYENSEAIDNFKPKKYYQVEADYGNFKATLTDNEGGIMQYDQRPDTSVYPNDGMVLSVEKKRTTEHAPKLYEMAVLQIEAGKKYGYTPSETMDLVESLYAKHKIISYPRTQCPYVSEEKSKEFKMMLSHMDVFPELAGYAKTITDEAVSAVRRDKQVVNDEEVQKESHDALLPTSKRPVLSELSEKERNICLMIFTRLLAQFLPKAADDKTKLVIGHGDGKFVAKGTTVAEQGWRVLYAEKKDKDLPFLEKGETVTAKTILPVEKTTTPPKRYTQSLLLEAMKHAGNKIEDDELRKSLAESNGIGTSSTRASIIADIIKRGYVDEKKGLLYISPLGKRYIQAVKMLDISSPEFAATMDNDIKKVKRGELDFDTVYGTVISGLRDMCRQVEKMPSEVKTLSVKCPVCGGSVKTGRFKYECENGDFSIQKNVCGREVEPATAEKLINGETSPLMQFKKKDGTKFEAKLVIKENKLCFAASVEDTDCDCPKCGQKLKSSTYYYTCESCGFKTSRVVCGKTIDEKLLVKLLSGETSPQFTFKKKDGETFKAKLKMDGDNMCFDFSSGIQCPKCRNADVVINKAGAFCDCGLKIFRKTAGKDLADADIKAILTKGKTGVINGLKGKTGKEFSAVISLKDDGTTEFVFDTPNSKCKCPCCGNETVKVNKAGAFCDCGLKIFRNMAGHSLTDAEITMLLTKGKTREIKDFEGKGGKKFSAYVILNDGKTEFEFPKKDGDK